VLAVAIVFVLLSWLGNIISRTVVGMPSPFVFEVVLDVLGDVVVTSSWLSLAQLADSLPQVLVDQAGFLKSINIHVDNWRFRSRGVLGLGRSSPSFFNTSYVPLVYDSNNLVSRGLVNLVEE
jgi:hypothetical protein